MGIWDKVGRGVGRAASEAEKQAAVAKLSLEINGTNGEVRKRTAELGQAVLKLSRSGDLQHAAVQELVAEVDALDAKVADLEKQLAEVKGSPAAASD